MTSFTRNSLIVCGVLILACAAYIGVEGGASAHPMRALGIAAIFTALGVSLLLFGLQLRRRAAR